MSIEAITAVATEVLKAKAAEAAQQQLIQKMTTGVEQTAISASVEKPYTKKSFRIGEISLPEIEEKDILKQQEFDAASELANKIEQPNQNLSIEHEGDKFQHINDVRNESIEGDFSSNADVPVERNNVIDSEGKEVPNDEIQQLKRDYINDVINKSEVPETIDAEKISEAEFKKCSPEETAQKREEFNQLKNELIEQWEKENGREWPTYDNDVYSSNGYLIRRAGDKYDAHHIHPLSMGGKNEVSNITPLHAECHYDRQGVHSPTSAYSKLEKTIGV